MGWTKREFIDQAFEEIGLAEYVFDLGPDQIQGALRKLDAMIATWNARGIRIGYPLPASPSDSDLDEGTGVPDSANEAIFLNLAVRLAPGYGKAATRDLKQSAMSAYKTLLTKSIEVKPMQLPSMPSGAGNKQRRGAFLPGPTSEIEAGGDGDIILE